MRWIILLILLTGCKASPGFIEIIHADGSSVTVYQPEDPDVPASYADSEKTITTGGTRQKEAWEVQLPILTWAGIGLCILGVGAMILKIKLPIIPTSAATTLLVAGVCLIILPNILGAIPQWLYIVGAIVAFTIIVGPGLWANRKDQHGNTRSNNR